MTATIAFCVAGWILGWIAFGRPRALEANGELAPGTGTGARQHSRRVVIIPARNEARNIAELLADLTVVRPDDGSGPMPKQLIIVVDDHSSDATAALAAAFDDVVVIAAPALPTGWTGKSWACWHGVAEAQERLGSAAGDGASVQLVFVDADVRMTSGALDLVTNEQLADGGLLSVQPRHDTVRPYEQLSALFNVVAVMGVGAGRRAAPTGAFGPVLVTTLADYRRAGGHLAVRSDVADDIALAHRCTDVGLPVDIRLGGDLISFRMYSNGVRGLLEGWAKNFCTGALSTRYPTLAATAVWVTALGSATLGLLTATGDQAPLLHVGIYLAFVAQLAVLLGRVGRFRWWTPVLYPAGLVAFFGVFTYSTWRTLARRSTTWSGRTIDLTAAATPVEAE